MSEWATSSGDTLVANGSATTSQGVIGFTVVSLPIKRPGRYALAWTAHSAGALGRLQYSTGETVGALSFVIEWGGANAWMFNPIPIYHTFLAPSTISITVLATNTSTYFAALMATPS